MAPAASTYDVSARNWTKALRTYRASVDIYRRFLERRADSGIVRAPSIARTNGHTRLERPADTLLQAPLLERLTQRERDVAWLMARGYTNQQIAETLVITRGTAANHVAHILAKLGLANRTQVAALLLDGNQRV